MSRRDRSDSIPEDRVVAQKDADRIHALRQELADAEVQAILALTPDQQQRFDKWSRDKLAGLAAQFDIDTTAAQKRVSWGMRIASSLGGFAICAAVVLFFVRYWGYLETPAQLAILCLTPLLFLFATEWMARRERTRYFTGILALACLASFILNLVVVGSIFNIASTERALLAWAAFALVLAYRYGLSLMLTVGLLLLTSYIAALSTTQMGYQWLQFYDRPEYFLLLGLVVFALPHFLNHTAFRNFDSVYRLVGLLTFFISILSLAEWGVPSYLPWSQISIERLYEILGLVLSAGAIWLGITRDWTGVVNTGAAFFAIFLYTRLYHWLWDWMPRYLFFALIGALAVALVFAFKRIRPAMGRLESVVSV